MSAQAKLFKLLTVEELHNLPPPTWLLQDLLVAGGFAVLYGPPEIGKSFVALDFALSIATNYAGIAAPKLTGPVVYVAAEGVSGVGKRIGVWEKSHGREAENFRCLPEAVNLYEGADTSNLIRTLRFLPEPPRLIVIDTMARCMAEGDENSAKDVGLLIANLDKIRHTFSCATLVIHDGNKSNQCVERGSSALRGAADTMLSLTRTGGDLQLRCEKQKDGAQFKTQILRLEVVALDDGSTSCVVRNLGIPSVSGTSAINDKNKIEILRILADFPDGLSYTDLADKFMASTGRSKSTFDRSRDALEKDQQIRKLDSEKYVRSEASGVKHVSYECHDSD